MSTPSSRPSLKPSQSSDGGNKRRRRETESQGGDQALLRENSTASVTDAALLRQGNKPATKRRKDDDTAPDDHAAAAESASTAPKGAKPGGVAQKANPTENGSEPITISDTESAVNTDGEDSVSAVKARTRTAAELAGVKTASGRRARFAQKYAGLSPEETLRKLSTGWRSPIYSHFNAPIIVEGPNGAIIHRFVCKRHPSKHVDRMEYNESTGNLSRHVKGCEPDDTPEAEMITAYASGVTYSPARLRFLVAMWVSRRHRPFTIVEDPEFRQILAMLYPKVQLPSRVTVSRDVQDIFGETKKNLVQLFKDLPGKIHICLDGWTSPNVISFLGVTAHWHQDGKIQHVILDFIKLTNSHTAAYLAEKFIECLRSFGIEEKILAVTCDNATTNDAMMREIKKLLPNVPSPKGRVRCFGHVLSLVVKGIMSQFARRKGKPVDRDVAALDDPEDADEEDLDAAEEEDQAREDADEEVIERMDEDHPDLVLPGDEAKMARLAVEKITRLSQKVWHSPTIRAELSKLADEANLNSEVLVRSVKTRWNTVAMVLERALEMKDVLNALCDMHKFNQKSGARLRRFILSTEEWTLLEQLYQLLDPFLFATNEISSSTQGLIHEVIPYFDVLTKHVDDFQDDEKMMPAVRAAAKRGRLMLNKYYGFTDETTIYRIAMILHPAYKDSYFRKAGWPEDWIAEARRLIVEEWTLTYKPQDEPAEPAASVRPRSRPRPGHMSTGGSLTRDMFSSIAGRRVRSPQADALTEYLESPPRATVQDPLAYWNAALASNSEDPALARMALDYLSIPSSSVDAERAFSRGRLTVSCLRRSLSDKSVRANTVLGSWARIAALVPEKDLVKFLSDKKAARAAQVSGIGAGTDDGESEVVDGGESAGLATGDDDDDDLYA